MKDSLRSLFTLIAAVGLAAWLTACTQQASQEAEPEPEVTQAEEPAPAEEPAAEAPAEEETASEEPAAEAGDLAFTTDDWDDFFVDKTIWVGSMSEFDMREEDDDKTEGEVSLRANAKKGDGLIRDLYIARYVDGLESGKTYKVMVDYRFDIDDPGQNYIQYDAQAGDHQSRKAIAAIEDYPDRPVESTSYVDESTLGSSEFHTLEDTVTLAEGEDDLTLMMIVRFQAKSRRQNWFYIDNFRVVEQ